MCEWPEDWSGQVPDDICSIASIPVWLVHGDADRNVPPDASQVMADALTACGGDVRFTLQEGVRHNVRAFEENDTLLEWLVTQGTDDDWPLIGDG